MLLISTDSHDSAFSAAQRAIQRNLDQIPDIYIEGIEEFTINWDVLKKQYRKRKPDPQKVSCVSIGGICKIKKDEVLYESKNGIRVVKEEKKKSFVPLLLPPPEIVEEEGKKTGIVPQDAIAAVISTVPRGKVVTKSRVKDFLVIVYSMYFDDIPYDAEANWAGYARYCHDFNEYGYYLYPHRLVSDQGEVYGNGMDWRYRGNTRSRRRDAEILSHEGVPTFENDYHCYVDGLEEREYDFDNLFVAIEKKE